jgi:hypothetical protein
MIREGEERLKRVLLVDESPLAGNSIYTYDSLNIS